MNSQDRKLRVAFMMPGGVAHYDKGLHIPALFNVIAQLSENIDITVYSFNVIGNESGEAFCGKATVKYISVHHKSHWFTKTAKILSVFIRDHFRNNYHVAVGLLGLPTEVATILAATFFRVFSCIYFVGGETAYFPSVAYGNLEPNLKGKLTRWVCRKADALILVSKFQIGQLRKFNMFREDAIVIPLGVDTQFFNHSAKRSPQRPYRFLHVANIHPVKDQYTLLRTFALINRKLPSYLKVAGADHMHGKIQDFAAEIGIRDRVEFCGILSQDKLKTEYEWADVLLHTSVYEASGVVIEEAAASGVLVCGTRVGFISDWGDHCVIAVEPGDFNGLAEKVSELLKDEERCSSLRQKGYVMAKAKNLDWTVNQLTQLFVSLTSRYTITS